MPLWSPILCAVCYFSIDLPKHGASSVFPDVREMSSNKTSESLDATRDFRNFATRVSECSAASKNFMYESLHFSESLGSAALTNFVDKRFSSEASFPKLNETPSGIIEVSSEANFPSHLSGNV
jgi:hypothetical protein